MNDDPQTTWHDVTKAFSSWADLTASGMTWAQLHGQAEAAPTNEENPK